MSFDDSIKTMAEKFYQVYREMTGKSAKGVDIQRMVPPYSLARYTPAITIPYLIKEEGFEGRFVLIFNDEAMAVKLAASIGQHAGMPAVDKMGETTTGIIFEFMNTIAGKVTTEWETIGRQADFFTPKLTSEFSLQNESKDAAIHLVSLILTQAASLSLLNILVKKANTVLKGKKILVVDDSKMIRYLLTTEFAKQGCQVSQAENGLDGFIRNQVDQPDLIIMDLVMPKMGGLEAIARIREMSPAVHIIVLTSTSKKEEVKAAAAHKVKSYAMKPIQMDQLMELARSCFE